MFTKNLSFHLCIEIVKIIPLALQLEQKLKKAFNSQDKSTDKYNLTVSSNLLQWLQKDKNKQNKKN